MIQEEPIYLWFENIFSPPKKSTSMQNLSGDMVSRIEYDEKEQECIAKEEQIQVRLYISQYCLFLIK